MQRKDFLKKLGLAAGAIAVAPIATSASVLSNSNNDTELSSDKVLFLQTYQSWLTEFNSFVDKQKNDFTNTANNKRLMELSEQANTWKSTLTEYMQDGKFAAAFYAMTETVRRSIS